MATFGVRRCSPLWIVLECGVVRRFGLMKAKRRKNAPLPSRAESADKKIKNFPQKSDFAIS
jgi:hypothetical protein